MYWKTAGCLCEVGFSLYFSTKTKCSWKQLDVYEMLVFLVFLHRYQVYWETDGCLCKAGFHSISPQRPSVLEYSRMLRKRVCTVVKYHI